jgi:hypothetical protein
MKREILNRDNVGVIIMMFGLCVQLAGIVILLATFNNPYLAFVLPLFFGGLLCLGIGRCVRTC